jgi:predicted nucleotide-binding protein (sugar kinase/HSP70/actin superfamily)
MASVHAREIRSLEGKKIYIHAMVDGGARLMAAAFRAVGLDAEVTPPSDAATLEIGSRCTGGDECFPARITVGDYMKVLLAGKADPARTVLFMPGADGPCRFGQYALHLRRVLREHGFEQTGVMSPSCADGYQMPPDLHRTGWRAVIASDILLKLLLQHRPYEVQKGSAEALYDECVEQVARTIETAPLQPRRQIRALRQALIGCRDRFRVLPVRCDPATPLIGVVGEIFCRLNSFSNADLIRRMEEYGAEVWLSDVAEWVWYSHAEQVRLLKLAGRGFSLAALAARLRAWIQRRDEHELLQPFAGDLAGYSEPSIEEILEAARPYLPQHGAIGEMVINAGKAVCLARRGVDGIVDISPFTCMNGVVSEAIYPRLSRDLGGIPIRNFYFDGTATDLDADLGVFLELVRSYRARKATPRPAPAAGRRAGGRGRQQAPAHS